MAESDVGNATQSPEVEAFRNECSHYSRGCSFVSPCCGKVYPCRLCHNDKELSHQIDRHAVKEVLCRRCSKRQPVAESCCKCELNFGKYFCKICRLYDDADKGQFHCDKCELCRVGGRDNYFHCDTCGFCLNVAMRDLHTCRQQMSKDNCPVCMEDIHTSTTAAHVPQCGHLIHLTCYRELVSNGLYQCPQCQTSLTNMTYHWQKMDAEKDKWQLPQHLKDFKVKVNCRDCHQETETDFHVIGFKCTNCGSYNTVRCGNEEIPEDNTQGFLGRLLRRVRGGQEGGARRRRRRSQREADDETDSESDTDDEGHNESDSDHRPDRDGGNGDSGDASRHENHDPDTEDRGHNASNTDSNSNAGGEVPDDQVQDEGVVDDASYDGDESDDCEEEDSHSSNSSSEDDMFFDCRNHLRQGSPTVQRPHRRGNNGYMFVGRPIQVPAGNQPGALKWWESEGEEIYNDCPSNKARSTSTFPPTRDRRNNNYPRHPNTHHRLPVESLQIMEIWGSDFYTDSFSEPSSDSYSSWETEEEEVMIAGEVCSKVPKQKEPVVKKGPSCLVNSQKKDECSQPGMSGETIYGSAVNKITNQSLKNYDCKRALTHTNQNVLYSPLRSQFKQDISLANKSMSCSPVPENSGCGLICTRVRSSSEDSWVTANEELELGTLV